MFKNTVVAVKAVAQLVLALSRYLGQSLEFDFQPLHYPGTQVKLSFHSHPFVIQILYVLSLSGYLCQRGISWVIRKKIPTVLSTVKKVSNQVFTSKRKYVPIIQFMVMSNSDYQPALVIISIKTGPIEQIILRMGSARPFLKVECVCTRMYSHQESDTKR